MSAQHKLTIENVKLKIKKQLSIVHCPFSIPKGFTLVELLVVISIIAILSVIGITIFSGVQKSARDAQRRGDIDAISKALEVHFGIRGVCNPGDNYCPPIGTYFSSGIVPEDPFDKSTARKCYIYLSPSGGPVLWPGDNCYGSNRSANDYKICADLESIGGWDGNQQDYCRSNQQ